MNEKALVVTSINKITESELERAAYKLLAMGVDPNSPSFKSNYGHLNLRIK
jgi:hypothetical protein